MDTDDMDMWTEESVPYLQYAVSRLIARYARGVDRRDWGLLRTLFHPKSLDEHGPTAGGVEDFIEEFSKRSERVPEMMHVTANSLILERDFARREVLVETYCVAWSRVLPGDVMPGSFYDVEELPIDSPRARVATIANRYLDLIVEHEGELKFLYRRVIYEWVTVAEVAAERPFGGGMTQSTRTSQDPSYRTLDQFREEYLARTSTT